MGTEQGDIAWLAGWFAAQSDGEWEHERGIVIETLDNPGWSLRVDLTGTPLEDLVFARQEHEDEDGWRRSWKDDGDRTFRAVGDASSLPALIEGFRAWAQGASPA